MTRDGQSTTKSPAPLGRAVGSGVSWFALATLATRAASLVAQIILGWLLVRADFGVFAIAVGLATILSIIRDGGVRELYVQRGTAGDQDAGALFWIAATFNLALGGLMALTGPLAAIYYGQPQLAPMLIIMAISVPISTFGSIFYAKLRIQLRFREAATFSTIAAVVRFASTVILAASGAGVFSFAWPWIVVAVTESLLGWWYVRERVWAAPPSWARWPALLREVRWLLLGRLGEAGLVNGDYVVAGKLLLAPALGVYFFAFQLVGQSALLLWVNLHTVLLPALTRLAEDQERFAKALHRAMRVQAVWSGLICFGLAAVIVPMELIMWRGKWAAMAPSVVVLCAAFPMRVTSGITSAAFQALGRFKLFGVVTVIEAVGFIAAALVGSLWAQSGADDLTQAMRLSIAITAYVIVARLAICALVFRVAHLKKRGAAVDILPAWVCGIGASTLVQYLTDAWFGGTAKPGVFMSIIWCCTAGGLFTFCFLAAVRIVIPHQLGQAIDVLPDRFAARRRAHSLLFPPSQARPPRSRHRLTHEHDPTHTGDRRRRLPGLAPVRAPGRGRPRCHLP